MSALSKTIRHRIVSLLLNQTAAGSRVFANRIRPLWAEELPAILIYTKRETITLSQQAPREYKRSAEITIEIAAKADESLDDTLDDIAEVIEQILFLDERLQGAANDCRLQEVTLDLAAEGEQPIGVLRLLWEVTYYQYAPYDQTPALPSFNQITAGWDLGPAPDGILEAKDDLTLSPG